MKKFLMLAVVGYGLLFASPIFQEYKTKIISIDGSTAVVKNFDSVQIGSSGVVVHRLEKKHSTIVAKIVVTEKNKNTMTVRFRRFDDLKQKVLPIPKILPKVGDEVILNFLYNHALAITPNYQTYKKVMEKHQDISWLHPDLFAAKLFTDSTPVPTRADFKNICRQYSFWLLYFVIDDKGYFVDCNSFKALMKENVDRYEKRVSLPFYSRIKGIKKRWLSFKKSEVSNYDAYYKRLIR